MTKKEMFATIIETVNSVSIDANVKNEITEFCNHELELLNRKSVTTGPSKKQIIDVGVKNDIVNTLKMIDKPVTVTELMKSSSNMGLYSSQYLTSLLTQLVKDDVIVRTVEKKKAYFSVAA